MKQLVIIGIGGFIGSILRYLISIFFDKKIDRLLKSVILSFNDSGNINSIGMKKLLTSLNLPSGAWGTVLVNLIGCFLFGLLFEINYFKGIITQPVQFFIKIGLIASFTTFSTFIYELIKIYKNEDWWTLLFYFSIQLFGGVLMVFLGEKTISLWIKLFQ